MQFLVKAFESFQEWREKNATTLYLESQKHPYFGRQRKTRILWFLLLSIGPVWLASVPNPMDFDPEVLIDSIEGAMDDAAKISYSMFLAAIAIFWASFQNEEEIEVIGMKLKRQFAYLIVYAVFFIGSLCLVILWFRIGDALLLLKAHDQKSFMKAASFVLTYHWVYNPISCFGASVSSLIVSSLSTALCVALWWVTFSAVRALAPTPGEQDAAKWLNRYTCLGALIVGSVQRVRVMIAESVPDDSSLDRALSLIYAFENTAALTAILFAAGYSRSMYALQHPDEFPETTAQWKARMH